jgi:hypothetical protein
VYWLSSYSSWFAAPSKRQWCHIAQSAAAPRSARRVNAPLEIGASPQPKSAGQSGPPSPPPSPALPGAAPLPLFPAWPGEPEVPAPMPPLPNDPAWFDGKLLA